ncbi:MAG: urease accessory protein UreD, partial [Gammaproteobacteria bacterium]
PCSEENLERVRAHLNVQATSVLIAVTRIDGLLVLRALGNNSEVLKQQLISVWLVLRPLLLDRPALQPRIWAT